MSTGNAKLNVEKESIECGMIYGGESFSNMWNHMMLHVFFVCNLCEILRYMFANFHLYGITFLLRAVFLHTREKCVPRGPKCFRCLMFSLSTCELLFLLCFIASWI